MIPILTNRGFKPAGRLRPRHARDIAGSPWSIGCETLDRDYVDFAHTGPHLGELGAKAARLQAGWAKCEPRADGVYRWEWLDRIVDGCVEQGVRPWLETSYGNPAYEGGGGIGLAEGPPRSPAALAGWDRWVRALAERYHDRVREWEIWNEPDIHNAMTPAEYTVLFIRTATIIRAVDPEAFIIGLGLAGSLEFARGFLEQLAAEDQTRLLSAITYHFYPHNPDDNFPPVEALREIVRQHAPHVTLRQGETGAPSETQEILALRGHPWSERKQAAWTLRRLLAHHARGIPMSLFQLADMQYTKAGGAKFEGRNSKGLLCINADKSVAYRKPSYFAAQHVFSTFDDRFELRALANLAEGEAVRSYAFAWTLRDEKSPAIVAWWRADDAPALGAPGMDHVGLRPMGMRDPVLVDFLSGTVFQVPGGAGEKLWGELPRADVPLAMAERSVLHLRAVEEK